MLPTSDLLRNSMGLSVFRCLLAGLVMKNMIFYLPMADNLLGPQAIVDYDTYLGLMHAYGLEALLYPFHVPYAPQAFVLVTFVVAFLLFFGVFGRVTAFVLWLLLLLFKQRNGFILDGSDNVIEVTLPFLILADAYRYNTLSTGSRWQWPASLSKAGQLVMRYASLALLIQICYVYFFTALAKLQGDLWLNGTATYYTMRVDEFRQTSWNIPLTENHYFVVLSTYFTILWELSFAFLIWFRPTKWPVIVGGVLLHLGIWYFMRIDNFSWIMIGSYAMFITNRNYVHALAYVRRFLPRRSRAPQPVSELGQTVVVHSEQSISSQN
ncbi:HTTM domain-containing protein [Microvirga sp. STR05]|uniref:HTTM domain-containing protein n=1 Tax=Hymenobacter duratus TaxID=2771356 RepID=A0ABR8JE55_9BACT|nr:HTTM domain-containing protein [Hymenobacter duratus]MBD2715125.1 HTTM domain-containing protein [Hymenobacter duratus]MBR7950031.1 HTTM domain-containing protein [Microvirga sp. STR05]